MIFDVLVTVAFYLGNRKAGPSRSDEIRLLRTG
jgi:hypothetical protein